MPLELVTLKLFSHSVKICCWIILLTFNFTNSSCLIIPCAKWLNGLTDGLNSRHMAIAFKMLVVNQIFGMKTPIIIRNFICCDFYRSVVVNTTNFILICILIWIVYNFLYEPWVSNHDLRLGNRNRIFTFLPIITIWRCYDE